MKLYITEELNFNATNIVEEGTDINEILDFLEKFSIKSRIKDNFVFIEEQKIILDEYKMNELFDTIFYMFKIEYACDGGAGCEFNINVSLI